MRALLLLAIFTLSACSSDPEPTQQTDAGGMTNGQVDMSVSADLGLDAPPDVDADTLGPAMKADERGPFGVAARTITVTDPARDRTLDIEIWFPSDTTGNADVLEFEREPNRTTYAELLDAAPDCPSRTTTADRNGARAAGSFPVIAFSHCHACTRYSSFTIAEHLASWGYVVIAPDHEENTMFDELAGDGAELGTEFLEVRAADVTFALDRLLDGSAVPELAAAVDETRVGVMGHSFGSVTAGLVAQEDPRIKAAMGIAAPMENPLLPGVRVADLDEPLMFLVAVEDNSIQEIGNRLIRDNFDKAVTPAFKAEVADAGHWSFSDLAGLVEMFAPGCGEDNRQTGPEDFTYLDPAQGRAIGAAYAVAFFEWTLRGDAGARSFLLSDSPWAEVDVASREP